jgi:hypothetical protein
MLMTSSEDCPDCGDYACTGRCVGDDWSWADQDGDTDGWEE